MIGVSQKLEIIHGILVDKESPLVNLLQPPLQKEEIKKKIASFSMILPEEVYSLFGWMNGVDSSIEHFLGAAWLFPGGGYYEFERAFEMYREEAGKDDFWNRSKFGIFESGGGDTYLIECAQNSPDFGKIYLYDIGSVDFDRMISIYDSLESLLSTIIECYTDQIYVCDKVTGVQTPDRATFLKEVLIAKKYNPNSEFWSIF